MVDLDKKMKNYKTPIISTLPSFLQIVINKSFNYVSENRTTAREILNLYSEDEKLKTNI